MAVTVGFVEVALSKMSAESDWSDDNVKYVAQMCRPTTVEEFASDYGRNLPFALRAHASPTCVTPYLETLRSICSSATPLAQRAARERANAAAAERTRREQMVRDSTAFDDCTKAGGGVECIKRLTSCLECCHIKVPSATDTHCNVVCQKNMKAYVCGP
jgi:hypothetical protein